MSQDPMDDYKSLAEGSKWFRVAHFLNWAASNPKLKGEAMSYADVLRVAMNYSRKIRNDNAEVKELRKSIGAVRNLLQKHHGRGLVTLRGFGIRATDDALDVAKNIVEPTARRHEKLTKLLQARSGLVKISELPATEEGRRYKKFVTELRSNLKELSEMKDTMLLLAAPAPKKE